MKPTRVSNLAEFAAQPVGCYMAGSSWLNLCAQRGLWFQAIWGRPDGDEIEALLTSLRAQVFQPQVHAALLDCTGLQHTTIEDAYRLRNFLEERQKLLGAAAAREALVCAGGLRTWLVQRSRPCNDAGPSQVFSEVAEALDWLGPALSVEERMTIVRLRGELISAPGLLERLGCHFVKHNFVTANVSASAKHLGCSRRSLQRYLAQRGTSFRAELNHHRLERAKLELSNGASVTWLAYELGFRSVQSFIRVFKRGTGVTPGVWRKTVLTRTPQCGENPCSSRSI